jgi:phospholipid/cholesterol/gamma-HCH transport system substrate-binding protein
LEDGMQSISTEAKVGIFVLIGLIILAYMSFKVGQQGFGLKKGYVITAVFDNVSGLEKKGASVQMAGVEIGTVEDISLRNGKALVTMRIHSDVKLPVDSTATIRTHGVLGDKYIEIIPGAGLTGSESEISATQYLKEGDQIRNTERQADLDRLLNQFALVMDDIKTITSSLSNTIGSEEGEEQIRQTLANVRSLSENLNRIVAQNDDKFNQMIDSLRSASQEMDKTFAALSQVTDDINKGKGTVGALVKDKTLADNLQKTLASLQDISNKINEGRGSIGKLVNDEETVNNLNEGLTGINRYINKAEQFRILVNYRGEYLFDTSNAKSYLEMRIQPKEDKFYLIGLVSDPRGRRQETVTTTNGVTTDTVEYNKDKLLLNAQIGKRFKDIVLRGGVFENTGGVGLDYYTLNDRLQFTFEAFDFGSSGSGSGHKAHLKAYGEYRLLKHIYLSAGWDDFISNQGNSSPFMGFSIKFSDDDLKYLLMNAPIPR